jgi:gas vesicle protein
MSHRHADSEKLKQITGVAALAGAVGALVALLYAPKSGADTRSKIRDAAKNQKDSLTNRTKTVDVEIDDDADTAVDRVKATATKATRSAKSKATTAKTTVKEKVLDLKKEANDMKDDIKK